MNQADPAEKARIHQALEDFHGNRGLAAVRLGMTALQLKWKIDQCEELKAAWGKTSVVVPSEADVIRRTAVEIPDSDDLRLAEHFVREDGRLSRGLDELKLTAEEKELARSIGKFNQKHFFRSMDIVGGGVTLTAVKILGEVSRVQERLQDVRALIKACGNTLEAVQIAPEGQKPAEGHPAPPGEWRKVLVQEERMLYQTLIEISDTLRKMFETGHKGQLLMAGIRLKLLGLNPRAPIAKKEKGKTKPGFSPTIEETMYEASETTIQETVESVCFPEPGNAVA